MKRRFVRADITESNSSREIVTDEGVESVMKYYSLNEGRSRTDGQPGIDAPVMNKSRYGQWPQQGCCDKLPSLVRITCRKRESALLRICSRCDAYV
jgi:hypothetical protein